MINLVQTDSISADDPPAQAAPPEQAAPAIAVGQRTTQL
jgi:hypothetical protein